MAERRAAACFCNSVTILPASFAATASGDDLMPAVFAYAAASASVPRYAYAAGSTIMSTISASVYISMSMSLM